MKYYIKLFKNKLWPKGKKRQTHTIVSTNNKIKNEKSANQKSTNISNASIVTQENENRKKNFKKIQLGNKSNLDHFSNIKFEMNNIKYNEIRRYYLNNSNNFINPDGLKCNILSAINCDDNILFYLFVFSFTNIKNYLLELIQIHIKNSKTNETVSKNVPFFIINPNNSISPDANFDQSNFQYTSNNYKLFSNVKIAIKIQENIKISKYANENTYIQDISMDNIFYVIEYRMWNNYYELVQI
ncbi:conserved Plasmodium protein, unknown function [Plasmodium berghei]|uniref:Uncharacterized protein n=2 Tax=Plasmodium berghei TaxID=5821 RepID=A0A509AI34_PLABA|nr:conserved Plasmodium protein, unknown function [Plasmodium berghei ANKA]CXI07300.1 conserved Plasmodium protein, unknown function [Plasmodium berghei]SCL92581.1 conserved Plasmodium protein, unknown function [Plasmodium berghei]SCM15670.1 conserved Plasmodium protein, unknown function [Plasmodium berghei]SCM17464.1 conserved Plasmodium protein, unknown function [Plasmodium berghei]SCN22818.1 conserved Plasmodium protein, unknown function [Plasmodium berghei]|eukprot:XP_034420275.1 conserved Plasmodium protein, unknown function [Plasmodium berghei ANKA]